MTCLKCQHTNTKKAGTTAKEHPDSSKGHEVRGLKAPSGMTLGHHRTFPWRDTVRVLSLMVEGMGIRHQPRDGLPQADHRFGLLLSAGSQVASVFQELHDRSEVPPYPVRRNVGVCPLQAQRTLKRNPKIAERHPDAGDTWLWTAIDADSGN